MDKSEWKALIKKEWKISISLGCFLTGLILSFSLLNNLIFSVAVLIGLYYKKDDNTKVKQ
jgi:hypothetical protein